MKLSPILLIGGAGLAYLAWQKFSGLSNAANKLEWSNPRIKVGKATASQIPVDVTLDITNPTTSGITLDYFHGNLLYQGDAISSFTFDANGKHLQIAPQRTTSITFTVLVKNIKTLQAIKNVLVSLLTGKKTDSVISVVGNMFAANMDIPVAFDFDIATGKMVAQKVAGIAGVKAVLEFSNNRDMEKYFASKRMEKKLLFSKN
jgi:hypothetical protein